MIIDLHTHTNASDGFLSREDVLEFAAIQGIDRIAITDHDTMVNTLPDPSGRVDVVPGVEMSCRDTDTGRKVHILCYLPQHPEALEPFFKRIQRSRYERGEGYFEELSRLYPVITRDRLDKYAHNSYAYMKQHFIDILIDYGYTDEVYGELYSLIFNTMLRTPSNPDYDSVETCLDAIRDAGGVAVLAHPSVYKSVALAHRLAQEHAIDGIEIEHYANTPEDKKELLTVCREYDLIVTGGSDYHARTNSGPVLVGMYHTTEEMFDRIANTARERK